MIAGFLVCLLAHSIFALLQNYQATDGLQKVVEAFNCKPVEGGSAMVGFVFVA